MSEISPMAGQTLRLAQISDCHLHADPRGHLAGMDTRQSLERVLQRLQQEPGFNLLLATGDLSHDASAESYHWLQQRLRQLNLPCYCLPGNHDDPATMRAHLHGGPVKVCEELRIGDWLLLFLDSSRPGSTIGHLGMAQRERLASALERHDARHILICLHHQPLPIGSSWMDRMALDDPESLFPLIEGDPHVCGLLWGHIHQEYDRMQEGRRLMGSPSTCIQFSSGVDEFSIDPLPPGFRWLELHEDGTIDTGVIRLESMPEGLDVESGGY